MSDQRTSYCLDANVLIQAWQKYYSPLLCPSYWDMLDQLGIEGRLFLPESVAEEIKRTDDSLKEWLVGSHLPIRAADEQVTVLLGQIFAAHPLHVHLVNNIKQRSLADPWLIAHAMREGACVVTKEEKILVPNSTRIRIPNVCENMGVRCINDFGMMEELGVRFSCAR